MDYTLSSLVYQADAFMDIKCVVQISIKWKGKESSRNYKADKLIINLTSLLQVVFPNPRLFRRKVALVNA